MRALILLLLEVQVMRQLLVAALGVADRRERDQHVELAPALLLNVEGRLPDDLLLTRTEGLVENVGCPVEALGFNVFAVGADEVDVDRPFAHRDLSFDRFFIGAACEGWSVGKRGGRGGGGRWAYRMLWRVMILTVLLTCRSCVSTLGGWQGAVCGLPLPRQRVVTHVRHLDLVARLVRGANAVGGVEAASPVRSMVMASREDDKRQVQSVMEGCGRM